MKLFTALSIIAVIQTVTSSFLNESIYMVTASSEMVGGTSETLCAQIQGPTEPISFTLTLDTGTSSITILKKTILIDFYKCIKFKVPSVVSDTVTTLHMSIKGKWDSMNKESKILIRPAAFISIIQTDKPIYKPGQTVLFRIVSLDSSFSPVNKMFKTVELQDPNSNRIAQWLDRIPVSGILDLSHPMPPEAAQGSYIITAWNEDGMQTSYTFDIKEYVLPKYEVTVQLPKIITILDTEGSLTVCGKYTYGEPVLGSVRVTVCRKAHQWFSEDEPPPLDICRKFELETNKSGCVSQTSTATAFALTDTRYEDIFVVDAELEEIGTGVIMKGSGTVSITDVIRTASFENAPSVYRPGIMYKAQVKVTGPDSSTMAHEQVYVVVQSGSSVLDDLTLTTDHEGMASFSLDTSLWKDSVSIQAHFGQNENVDLSVPYLRRPRYLSAYLTLSPFYSKSRSFIQILSEDGKWNCDTDGKVHAQYVIQGQGLKQSLNVFYMVLSKGSVVQHDQLKVSVNGKENKGVLTFSLNNMAELAPVAQVVVYTLLPSGEGVADSMNFPIQPCLKNKVSLNFSSVKALPAEKTSLTLRAYPGSLCSVRAIDQSILLLQKEPELSIDSVYNLLPVQRLDGYSHKVQDDEADPCPPPFFLGRPRIGPISWRPFHSFDNDVYAMFKNIGIKILTNSIMKQPNVCTRPFLEFGFPENQPFIAGVQPEVSQLEGPIAPKVSKETLRSFFPETWIWDLLPVGEAGSVSVEKTVPDTITKWAVTAFCTSPAVGLGLAPNVGLTAFQPFFVSLTLPYSVVRGESFTLRATVFNYLSTCIYVRVTLYDSKEFTNMECDGCKYTLCLCGGESMTFSWIVTPISLGEISLKVSAEALKSRTLCENEVVTVPEKGHIDTVIQKLLVEAEGMPVSVTYNALLCPAEGPAENTLSPQLPGKYVAGSAKAFISILGDIMGRAMRNLDSLLAMPYGCGEQNMLLFAPNIYILNYLKSTGQLTQSIQDKATVFLQSGYQRELNYKHNDGSYSAFGNNDESGNTWLTAFVMKSFGGAQPFIFVDPLHISDAKAWLLRQQREDGCFNSVGKLFHNDLKGGVGDIITLSAYITAALVELEANAITDPMVQKSLSCLKVAVAGQLDIYTTALLSYTFTLAEDWQTRTKLITYLDTKASTQGGTRHWARTEATPEGLDPLEVEMTSYVLLALLSGPTLAGFGLDYSSTIVRWLVRQQNPYGGFASTQDTVVALQALAKYGASTYSPVGSTTVSVSSAGVLKKQYTVNQNNRLLYQEDQLSEVLGEYTVKAVGKSCVFVQIALHYNIPPPADFSAFILSVVTRADCTIPKPQLSLSLNVRYNGKQTETNMVVINLKLLSGFIVDEPSVQLLKQDKVVKKVDIDQGYVNIYLDRLRKGQAQVYAMAMQQDVMVTDLKPAVVKLYDYYNPSEYS